MFNSIVVICRRSNSSSLKTVSSLIQYLTNKQVRVFLEEETADFFTRPIAKTISVDHIRAECDLVAAVGGDGSFLSAGRIAAQHQLPIIGINRGSLGFLTDITANTLEQIGEILQGRFQEEERLLLETTLVDQHQVTSSYLSLNDVVFLSQTVGHIAELTVYIDQTLACCYRADGLIITTPTGSTAHALASGGPILHPSIKNIALVPILSHNLSSRSIVIDSTSTVEVLFEKKQASELAIICDGYHRKIIQNGRVSIKKASEKLRLLHPINYDYFNILRTKLHWEKEHKNCKKYADLY